MNRVAFLRHVAILACYGVLTLGMTWPVATSLKSALVGEGGDPWQTMWRFEEKADAWHEAVASDQVGMFLRQEFLGGGEARLVNLSVWPWMWVYWLAGLPLAYNVIWLLTFVLSGYGMYLFVRELGPPSSADGISNLVREAPAFLAGMYFMFLPYHVAHGLGHFGAMQLQWLPLIAWSVLRLYRTQQWTWAIVTGILLTVLAWTEHHYMLWVGIFSVVALVFWRQEVKSFWVAKKGRFIALAVGVWFLASVVVPYYPTVRLSQQPGSALSLGEAQTIRFSSDLFAFILPASFQPVWGRVFGSIFTDKFTGNVSEATQYLGVGALLLLLFFHQHIPRRQKFFWLLVGGVFGLIALGPYLHVFGHVLPVSLPYSLIQGLPVLSAVRAVGRAGVMIGFSSTLLLFWVLRNELHRLQSAIVLAGILLLDFLFFPMPMQSAALPAVYSALSSATGSRLIEIPTATNYTAASRALFASHAHGKELLGDIALERADTAELELIKSVPGIRQLLYLRTTELRRDRSEFFSQSLPESLADALRFFDVGAIIIHTDSVSALQLSSLRGFLEEDMHFTPMVVEDAIAYTFNPSHISVASDGVFLTRDKWTGVGFDPARQSVFAEVETEATLTTINVTNAAKQAEFAFTIFPFPDSAGRLVVKDEQGVVVAEGVIGDSMRFTVPALPGAHTFTFMAVGGKVVVQNPSLTVR